MSKTPELAIDIMIEAGTWPDEASLGAFVRRIVRAALARAPERLAPGAELSLVFTDDARVRELNAAHRGIDKATNVLSFPLAPAKAGIFGPMLGDIVIAEETLRREATAGLVPDDHHLAHLIMHGFLHLLGYDHHIERDAVRMEHLETLILADLGIADPYRDTAVIRDTDPDNADENEPGPCAPAMR